MAGKLIVLCKAIFSNGGGKMDTNKLLGKSVKVFLKAGGCFWFKITGSGPNYIKGYDDTGLDLLIYLNDIEKIL
jgi:hypothetical protein